MIKDSTTLTNSLLRSTFISCFWTSYQNFSIKTYRIDFPKSWTLYSAQTDGSNNDLNYKLSFNACIVITPLHFCLIPAIPVSVRPGLSVLTYWLSLSRYVMYVKKCVYYLTLRDRSNPSLILFRFTFSSCLSVHTGDKYVSLAQSGLSSKWSTQWERLEWNKPHMFALRCGNLLAPGMRTCLKKNLHFIAIDGHNRNT